MPENEAENAHGGDAAYPVICAIHEKLHDAYGNNLAEQDDAEGGFDGDAASFCQRDACQRKPADKCQYHGKAHGVQRLPA